MKKLRCGPCVSLVVPITFAFCQTSPAQAEVKFWNTTSSDYWHVGPWVPAGPPTAADTALFDITAVYAVKFNAVTGDPTINDLLIGTGNVTFQSEGGTRTLHVTGTGGSKSVSVSPGTLTLGTSGGPMVVDVGGPVNVNGGGTLNVAFDSDVNAAGNINVGTTGNGKLSINGAGSTVAQSGSSTTNVGQSTLGPTAAINIGSTSQNGQFTTGAGGLVINETGTVAIGSSATTGTLNAAGDVLIDGGVLQKNSDSAFNLAAGKTVTIKNGGRLTMSDRFHTAPNTTYRVEGAGSKVETVEISGDVLDGILIQDATVSVSSGGSLLSPRWFYVGAIGDGTPTVHTLTVDGAGSSAVAGVDGYITIWGDVGEEAHVTFSNGSRGSFGQIELAWGQLLPGAVSVVDVLSGADLSSLRMGIAADGRNVTSGTLTVDGSGSTATITSNLVIGHSTLGTAVINVLNGGVLTLGSGGTTSLNATGTININGGRADLKTLADNGGTINFNSGALSYIGHLTVGTGGLLGSDLTLGSDRSLAVSEITTVDSLHKLTLDGGTFYTGALVPNGTFDFQRGTLGITGAFGLTIGGGGTFGANLTLRDGQTLNVIQAMTINAGALLVVESGAGFSSGFIINSGELVLDGLAATATAPTVSNGGLIRGEGRILGNVTNAAGGEIRAEAGKRIKLQGTNGTNVGTINLQGGTAEFADALTNSPTGQVLGRGTLIVGGTGLNNQGHIAFSSGITDVFGDVVNNTGDATRGITVSGNADVTFWDDVNNVAGSLFRVSLGSSATFFGAFSGAGISGFGDVYFEADVTPGASPATASFGGNVSFGPQASLAIELGGTLPGSQYDQLQVATVLTLDGALEVLLIDGFSPSAGQSFDILDWEKINGTFASISLPSLSPLEWDTSQLYTTGVFTVVTPGIPGDYNQNGTVDAADYVVWRKSDGTPGGYNTWRANFGRTAGSGAVDQLSPVPPSAERLSAAVPEPASFLLIGFGLAAASMLTLRRH